VKVSCFCILFLGCIVWGGNNENLKYSNNHLMKQIQNYNLSECYDFHDWCGDWANIFHDCEKNPGYMNHYCAKSCNTCHLQTKEFRQEQILNSLIDCSNLHFGCSFWAYMGECQNNANYMNKHCALACNTCPLQIARFRDDYCLDAGGYDECKDYLIHEKCHDESLRDILHTKCRKTCDLCSYPNISSIDAENTGTFSLDVVFSIITQIFIILLTVLLFMFYFVKYLSVIFIYLFYVIRRVIVRASKSVLLSALYEYEVVC